MQVQVLGTRYPDLPAAAPRCTGRAGAGAWVVGPRRPALVLELLHMLQRSVLHAVGDWRMAGRAVAVGGQWEDNGLLHALCVAEDLPRTHRLGLWNMESES